MHFPPRLPAAAWQVVGVALLSGPLLAWMLLYLRTEVLRTGQERTDALTQVIAEQSARTLQSVDGRLQLVIARLQALQQAGTLEPARAQAMLEAELKDLPFVRSLWVVDSTGRLTYGSDPVLAGESMADRPYFQAYVTAPAAEFFVGPPLRSRRTGQWIISASRPWRDSGGKLQGVVTAAVEPSYFDQLWRRIDLGENGAVALFRRNGQLMVRSPMDEDLIGQVIPNNPLFLKFLPRAPEGVFMAASPVDQVERIVGYRELPVNREFVIAVGTSQDAVLAAWRRQAGLAALVWLGAVLGAVGLTWQLHRQSRSRERTEQRLQQLVQVVPQIVFIIDAQGGVQFVSQRWTELTGRRGEEALHDRWQQSVHPDDRQDMVDKLGEALRKGQQLELEYRLRYRDGGFRWQLLRAVPFREGRGDALSWYGAATDIDDLKRAQDRLREQAELLKVAGRLARMGAWRIDVKTQRVTWSEEAATILDLPADSEPTMQEMIAMLAPASLPLALQSLQECIDHAQPFDVEVAVLTPTGRKVWLRTIGQPLVDAQGKVVAVQGAQQDITPRIRMPGKSPAR